MIEIRPADLHVDRELLIDNLLRHLTRQSTPRRYQWFYLDNPHGAARAWIAFDPQAGLTIGSAAIMPRRMRAGQREFDACVMADFWIHPEYRSLGPAVKLQRACIDGAAKLGTPFFFDMPQASMPAVYKRLRIEPREQLIRLTKPLRADDYFGKRMGRGAMRDGAAAIANIALKGLDLRFAAKREHVVAEHTQDFDSEFTALVEAMPSESIVVARSSEYLNWRYRAHYFLQHTVITVRVAGVLKGCCVLAVLGADAQVVDLFGTVEPDVLRSLITGASSLMRARGVCTLNLPLLQSDRRLPLIESLGFRRRDARPVVVHPCSNTVQGGRVDAIDHVLLTYGDLDY